MPAPGSWSLKTLRALSSGVLSRGMQYIYLDAQDFLIPRECYGTFSMKMNICILRECTDMTCTSLVNTTAIEHLEILVCF